MKNISLRLSLLLGVLLSALTFMSCGDSDDEPEAPEKPNPLVTDILGTWSGEYSCTFEDMKFTKE